MWRGFLHKLRAVGGDPRFYISSKALSPQRVLGVSMYIHRTLIEEVRKRLESLQKSLEGEDRYLVEEVLREWDRVAEAMDIALLNHIHFLLTFVITEGSRSIFVAFQRKRKTWSLKGIRLGSRGGWRYRWEYILGAGLIERKTVEKVVMHL